MTITVLSYFLGQKYYPVNYNIKVVLGLIAMSAAIYYISEYYILEGWLKYITCLAYLAVYGLVGYRILLSIKKPKFAD